MINIVIKELEFEEDLKKRIEFICDFCNNNYRNYDNKQDDIYIVRGTTSVVDDVKRLYKEEFEESVKE